MLTCEEFERLFDQHVDDVAAFLNTYATGRAQLKDWVQEVFIKLWESREQIDFEHPAFKSYLFTTARNLALKKLRNKKRYDAWLDQYLVQITTLQSEVDNSVDFAKLKKKHDQTLSHISDRARQAYLLSRNEGLTYQEIADVMDISVKTVEVHISKALRILKKALKDYA